MGSVPYHSKREIPMNEEPLISVIITSYSMERLRDVLELLDSIKGQTYSNIETIFVAERDVELSARVNSYVKEKAIPNVKVIFNDGEPGACAARNLGILEAKGNIVSFIDDDAVAFPEWAEEMVKAYQDDSVVGVTGPAFPLWEDESMSWFPEEFYWILSCSAWFSSNDTRDVRNVWLENASFRKEVFELAGYLDTRLGPQDGSGEFKQREFNEGIVSEEVELSLRIKRRTGKRIIFNPKVKVRHRVYKDRLEWSYIRQWAYWMGLSKYKLKKLYPKTDDGKDSLGEERRLLKRIFFRLLPNIIKDFFKDPFTACRKFAVTATVLLFVASGYYAHLLPGPFRRQGRIKTGKRSSSRRYYR